jgi:DNA topoisomerase IA/topoisomerase IA-like protein
LNERPFVAKLIKWNDQKIATEKDFDGGTGEVRSKSFIVLDSQKNEELMNWLHSNNPAFTVSQKAERTTSQHPSPPFITSTLQQDASRKLGFSPERTMSIAQQLYEAGHITYMRTDSPSLSSTALEVIEKLITTKFGAEYYVNNANSKRKKDTPKNAQEAHEAIRPALIDNTFKTGEELNLEDGHLALYNLIYKRTLATQMKESKSLSVTYTLENESAKKGKKNTDSSSLVFRFSQSRLVSDGFLKIWGKTAVSTASDPIMNLSKGQKVTLYRKNIANHNKDGKGEAAALLTELHDEEEVEGEMKQTEDEKEEQEQENAKVLLNASDEYPGIMSNEHSTRPPVRFTEASFISELESAGVGRPSTYSSIIQILKTREFIVVDKKTIVPSLKGIIVSNFLEKYFREFINEKFTAEMEKNLDLIACGKEDKLNFLKLFYQGRDKNAKGEENSLFPKTGLLPGIMEKLDSKAFDRKVDSELQLPYLSEVASLKLMNGEVYLVGKTKNVFVKIPSDVSQDIRLLTKEFAEQLIANAPVLAAYQTEWTDSNTTHEEHGVGSLAVKSARSPVFIGTVPNGKKEIYARFGMFGRYLTLGKDARKGMSLPSWFVLPGNPVSDNNTMLLTPEIAAEILELPKSIGIHPQLGLSMMFTCYAENFIITMEGMQEKIIVPAGFLFTDIVSNKENILTDFVLPKAIENAGKDMIGVWEDIPAEYKSLIFEGKESPREKVVITYRKGQYGPYLRCGAVVCSVKEESMELIPLSSAISRVIARCERIMKKAKEEEEARAKMEAKSAQKETPVEAEVSIESTETKTRKVPKKSKAVETQTVAKVTGNSNVVISENTESSDAKTDAPKKRKARRKSSPLVDEDI